ncbi:sulfite exporter TauE/SafE family protein [uncultured Draconibacterium sp.]|uniref:sulfite exporter TauE/SafE family protein n=1 Tax=uncultured Draconibacterium sp. TaxID=1573823 RepID=UPI002AA8F45F|nr:sulfite exporter TauE/SafE family protein [uncultured Draconibacterium sp.]
MNELSFIQLAILSAAGVLAGFINVVAGGGSLITLPLMIFLGLPPVVANGTNRIGIIAQNIVAVTNFSRKGVSVYPYSLYAGGIAVLGSIIGSMLALEMDDQLFNRILSIVMVVTGTAILLNNKKTTSSSAVPLVKNQTVSLFLFFFIGIYGGFIHVGIGFLMILILSRINMLTLKYANSIKVFVALLFSISSIIVFILNGAINWKVGFALAIGTSVGGYLGSHFTMKKSEKWIKLILILAIAVMAVKLWFIK